MQPSNKSTVSSTLIFGKAPFYDDFLKLNYATNQLFVEFEQDIALLTCTHDFDSRLNLLFFVKDTIRNDLLIASLQKSNDSTGRSYPLIIGTQQKLSKFDNEITYFFLANQLLYSDLEFYALHMLEYICTYRDYELFVENNRLNVHLDLDFSKKLLMDYYSLKSWSNIFFEKKGDNAYKLLTYSIYALVNLFREEEDSYICIKIRAGERDESIKLAFWIDLAEHYSQKRSYTILIVPFIQETFVFFARSVCKIPAFNQRKCFEAYQTMFFRTKEFFDKRSGVTDLKVTEHVLRYLDEELTLGEFRSFLFNTIL